MKYRQFFRCYGQVCFAPLNTILKKPAGGNLTPNSELKENKPNKNRKTKIS